jgi:prophage regulatory protein
VHKEQEVKMTNASERVFQFIRIKTVRSKTGLSTASIYNKLKPDSKYYDPDFPKQIKVGGGIVVWIEYEIDDWMNLQIQKSRDVAKKQARG